MRRSTTKNRITTDRAEPVSAGQRAPKNRTQQYLIELRDAMSDGWQIVQPIFVRPLWSSLDDHETAFHFVLQRERATKLVTVPQSNAVARFIREQSLAINQR